MSKCDKPHINECPDYMRNNSCPRGSNCPLVHRIKKIKKKKDDQKAIDSLIQSAKCEPISVDIGQHKNTEMTDSNVDSIKLSPNSVDNSG
jgi:hypothetical protein